MDNSWMIPTLSLQTQLSMERERRAAAHLSRDQLNIVVDQLIQHTYQQQELINRALGRVRHLEVELTLQSYSVPLGAPSQDHHRWAQELRGPGSADL